MKMDNFHKYVTFVCNLKLVSKKDGSIIDCLKNELHFCMDN
ncbi:hypothetical protein HNQ94_001146 [Salirhabdus euzebyi]|uniref:Uncharacterized protein n=1 Tax=Salirhabdus euzebyi TaxID=394506 RepID=A0A841PV66_9BACI|nr:hypothetical protein [Salirhabdus euzebyi]